MATVTLIYTWKKVINLVDVKCLSESVYGDNGKYMKSKIKNMEIE